VRAGWIIKTEGLTKNFSDRLALDSIELDIRPGQVLAILGRNGAGKTTLLKLLATIMKPSSGKISAAGTEVKGNTAGIRRLVGISTHETFLYSDLTAYENLSFYCQMYDVAEAKERIYEVMAKVGMTPRLHERVGVLSHGMQRRISLARSLLHRPKILLLDEPTSGLDPQTIALVWQAMIAESGIKRAVVFTTTDPEAALEFGERIVILDEGRIIYDEEKLGLDPERLKQIYERCVGPR